MSRIRSMSEIDVFRAESHDFEHVDHEYNIGFEIRIRFNLPLDDLKCIKLIKKSKKYFRNVKIFTSYPMYFDALKTPIWSK